MRRAQALVAIAIGLSLAGCALRKTPSAKAAPPPKPAAPPPPVKPAEPLSIPQTTVELPQPQPVPPEALAPPPAAVTPAPAPASPKPAPRPPARSGGSPPRVEAPAVEPVPPPRPPISEVIPAAELKRLKDEAGANKREALQLIGRIPRSRRAQQKAALDRIQAFLKQSDDAERRGDMRQASELAARALVLAKELKP